MMDADLSNAKGQIQMSSLFYKFLPAIHAIKVMEEKSLKVSTIPELNDIYDLKPTIIRADDEAANLSKDESRDLLDHISRSYGLICFSEAAVSPVLWGHYAACGTGLALGFDSDLFGFHKDCVRIHVSYDRLRPTLAVSSESLGLNPILDST